MPALTDPPDYGPLVRRTWEDWAAGKYPVHGLVDWSKVDADSDEAERLIGAAVAKAERERLFAELGNDHWVVVTEDGWTTEHSVECRLSGQMAACRYHSAFGLLSVRRTVWPDLMGRWRIAGIDTAGMPILQGAGDDTDAST